MRLSDAKTQDEIKEALELHKLSLTEVANALIENDNGWGLILAKIIEKL